MIILGLGFALVLGESNKTKKKGKTMKEFKKKTAQLAMAVITAVTIQGCSDTELALGAGIIIGTVIGSSGNDHDYDDNDRPERYNGGRNRRQFMMTDESAGLSVVDKAAKRYEISQDSAEILMTYLDQIKKGDLSAVEKLGLNKKEFAGIMQGEKLSDRQLAVVTETLKLENISQTEKLIKKLSADSVKATSDKKSSPLTGW